MATQDINVFVNQDIPAANVKVSITSRDYFRNDQERVLYYIKGNAFLPVLYN